MDKTIFPDERKWVTPRVNLGDKADGIRLVRQEFMFPISQAAMNTREHDQKQQEKQDELTVLANIQLEKIKKKLFEVPPKPKKGRKRANKDNEDDDDGLDELENGYELPDDIDELLDEDEEDVALLAAGSDSGCSDYETDSDDDRPRALRKYNAALDEIFIFNSDESDSEEEAKDQEQVGTAANGEPAASLPKRNVKTESMDTREADDSEEDDVMEMPQSSPLPEAAEEKDAGEFDLFHKYGFELNSGVAKNLAEDLLPLKYIIMGPLATNTLGNHKIKTLANETNPHLAATIGEVIVDTPIIRGSELPLLAGPIQKGAVENLGSLALYTGLSDEPGRFQWKMSHVVELLTAQLNQPLHTDPAVLENPHSLAQDDFIVTVTMYQCYEQPEGDAAIDLKTVQEPEFAFEIEILGSQTLKELAKMLRCQNDLYCTREFVSPVIGATASKAFEECQADLAKTKCPEFLLLVDDTIYTKPRIVDEANLSKGRLNLGKLLQWTKSHAEEIGDLKLGNLSVKIKDLTLRFGYPYVYIHQESCEHLIVFNSLRLPRTVEHTVFPRYQRLGKHPTRSCTVDNDCPARWVVVGCDRLPQDPMFLCDDCVRAYCCNRSDPQTPIGEFKLYPYLQLAHYL